MGGSGPSRLITTPRLLDNDATVDAIMNKVNHTRRMDIISDLFVSADVDRITQVPINTSNSPDTHLWAASDDGIFHVRDAYSIAINSRIVASTSRDCDPLWKKLWKLRIPPKAKIFLWRVS